MIWKNYFRCGIFTTLNILLYSLTLGHFIWLEGRVRGGKFRNWIRQYTYAPIIFAQPTTEAEIIDLVKNAEHIRVFGSGHSFNRGIQTEETLISLDKYSGLIRKDLAKKQMTFRGGTRVRDVTRTLLADGLAFAALPSHDAQSLAGIISTDVHGTGKNWGFVSESVLKIKLIDGKGDVHECKPTDDLFKAAIGGIGTVGIISEVTIQAVDRFNVEQRVWVTSLDSVKDNLDQLIQENDHLSLYIFPYTNKCQINAWNKTDKTKSFLGNFREFIITSLDALVSAWFGNFLAYSGLLPSLSNFGYGLKKGSNLVLESNSAFNRTIYPLHQELEFTVPFQDTVATYEKFVHLYENFDSRKVPYTLFELRFTPAGHNRTLIGPGRERRSTWIDVICNDSPGYERFYQAIEKELKQMGARPHLGKFCQRFNRTDFETLYPATFARFCQLKEAHDPEKKFVNPFTRQLFED
jgi:hypothetical protein